MIICHEDTKAQRVTKKPYVTGSLCCLLSLSLSGKFGPGVFDIASVIGKVETVKRIQYSIDLL